MPSISEAPTIGELLAARFSEASKAVALLAPGRMPLSYGRLAQQATQVTSCLCRRQIGRNDRVAVVLPNGPDLAAAFLAVATSATCIPLATTLSEDAYEFFLKDLDAKALLVQSNERSPARDVARHLGLAVIDVTPGREAGAFSLAGPASRDPSHATFAEADDVALLLYSSGTTARPKLVPLTHTNLIASARNHCKTLELSAADRCLNFMPLTHIHGLVSVLLSSVHSGASVCCMPAFDGELFFDWLATYRPSWYTASPAFHQAVLDCAMQNTATVVENTFRFIRSAAAPLPRPVLDRLERTFGVPVIESYGMTEAAAQICSNPLPPGHRASGSVGPAAGPEVAVMGVDGAILPPEQTGEIVIRGANVTGGYMNDPAANQEAFTEGWLRTGDLGHRDGAGYFYITGRKKEIINRGGENISPREIDEVLLEHPAVAEAAVFSVPHPRLGEDIAAAVVLRGQAELGDQDLRAFALARLAEFKVPSRFVFVSSIPKSDTGKLSRISLQEKLSDRLQPEFVSPETEAETAILCLWQELLKADQLGVDDNFFANGGDSILATQLVSRLNANFGLQVPVALVFEHPTIRRLARAVQGLASGRSQGASPIQPIRPSGGVSLEDVSRCRVSHAPGVLSSGTLASRPLRFSIYFFSADGSTTSRDQYGMLKDCSQYADQNGFSAIWIPERHFSPFGGLYPSTSVLASSVATLTEQIQIRAGSVAIPLQDPLRVAEEWSVIDNLSGGRVGIACVSGWHPNDFVLGPTHYTERRRIMIERIATIRKLWKGAAIRRPNGLGEEVDVRILPRPIQPNLPIWLAAHSDETFVKAGEIGANIVTNIWKIDLRDLARQIALYRESWEAHGEAGTRGIVTLMIHTFLGESDQDAINQIDSAYGEYLFTFLKLRDAEAAGANKEFELSPAERANLVAQAKKQLYESRGLVGTADRCMKVLESIRGCDVDEVACLIDFGIERDAVMQSLQRLAGLKDRADSAQ